LATAFWRPVVSLEDRRQEVNLPGHCDENRDLELPDPRDLLDGAFQVQLHVLPSLLSHVRD